MPEATGPGFKAVSNRDFDFFYDGLASGKLMVQRCGDCDMLRSPPGPICPNCRSFQWTALALQGGGTLYSYTVHHHPPLPGFETPLPVGLAEMDEGIRMIGPMDGTPAGQLRIGVRIETQFVARQGVAGYRFRPAAEAEVRG